MAKKYLIRHGDQASALDLRELEDGAFEVREGEEGEWRRVHLDRAGDSGLYVLMLDNRPLEIYLERRRGGAVATIGRHSFDCDVGPWRVGAERRAKTSSQQEGVVKLTAPMTGSVVEVRCKVGDRVSEGDVLLVIESMKMNNELRAPANGTVTAVPVAAGDRINGGAMLVTIEVNGGAES